MATTRPQRPGEKKSGQKPLVWWDLTGKRERQRTRPHPSDRSSAAEIASYQRAIEMNHDPLNPIRAGGTPNHDIMPVFRGIPGVGAGLSRHSCRTLPYFTHPETHPACTSPMFGFWLRVSVGNSSFRVTADCRLASHLNPSDHEYRQQQVHSIRCGDKAPQRYARLHLLGRKTYSQMSDKHVASTVSQQSSLAEKHIWSLRYRESCVSCFVEGLLKG